MLTIGIYGIKDTPINGRPGCTHDHSVTIMKDGRVLSVVTLERYTGIKHDQRLEKFIVEVLEKWVAEDEPVRFVSVNSFAGHSFSSEDGTFKIEPLEAPTIKRVLTPARVTWLRNKKNIDCEGWIMCHEFAHIAAALPFGMEFNPEQLLVHIDGGASDSSSSFWRMQDVKNPELLRASWDDLKNPVNNFNVGLLGRVILGLDAQDHLAMPGKLMGYASYGKTNDFWRQHLVERKFYFDEKWNEEAMLQDLSMAYGKPVRLGSLKEDLPKNLAFCVQKYFEDEVFSAVCEFKNNIGAKELIYTGGAALNIPTNALLEEEFGFGNVFVPPCTSDSGLSLGAAAWIEYVNGNKIHYHGPFLNSFATPNAPVSLNEVPTVAKAIADGKTVALCIGGSEIGPRALGHRTILARPDDENLKIKVSEQIKKREWYRPIAPVMLPEVAEKALMPEVKKSKLAPYMLGSYKLHQDWHEKFSGVLHADGTLRAQVLYNSPENAFLYKVLQVLNDKYGIVGTINTSFNVKGEPIVHYHEQVTKVIPRMGIDMGVIHGSLYRT